MKISQIKTLFALSLCLTMPINISAQSTLKASSTEVLLQVEHPLSEELTLDKCIEIALANNPSISQKQLNVDMANAEKEIAKSKIKPRLNMKFGFNHTIDNQALIKSRLVGDKDVPYVDDILSGDFVLSMPIYTGRKLENKIKSAELNKQAAKSWYKRSKRELVFNVSNIFYSMLGQKQVLNSLEFSKTALEGHRKRVSEFLSLQKAAKVDLLRTEVRLADIEQRLIRERNVLNIQRSMLLNLLGISRTDSKANIINGELTINEIEIDTDAGYKIALGNRQDYQALLRKVEAQNKMFQVARAERRPEVSLVGSYGNRWTGALGGNSEEVGQIGVMASLPIFEGGRIKAAVKREQSKLQFQNEELRKLSLQIQLEVRAASLNVQSTKARIGVTEKAVAQAKESLRIEREKYDNGKGVIVDVLDAQSALLGSQTNYFRALADLNSAIAQFNLATGEK